MKLERKEINEIKNLMDEFNQCMEKAGKVMEKIHKILEENDIEPDDFENASSAERGYWMQDFALTQMYDITASLAFLQK